MVKNSFKNMDPHDFAQDSPWMYEQIMFMDWTVMNMDPVLRDSNMAKNFFFLNHLNVAVKWWLYMVEFITLYNFMNILNQLLPQIK